MADFGRCGGLASGDQFGIIAASQTRENPGVGPTEALTTGEYQLKDASL